MGWGNCVGAWSYRRTAPMNGLMNRAPHMSPTDMPTLRSADGTPIAYQRTGAGPAVVVVAGAFCDHASFAQLGAELATDFTVFSYDRRGRGQSGDAPAYAVAREVEDLGAIIAAAGGAAALVGHSSGAALALEAAVAGLPVTRLVAFEPPYRSRPVSEQTMGLRIGEHVAAGRLDEAVAHFFTHGVGVPAEALAQMQASPAWSYFLQYAKALPYEIAVAGERGVPEHLAKIDVPTQLLAGAQSWPWIQESTRAAAAIIPGATHRELAGQTHEVAQEVFARAVREFLSSS